uniref:Uncharacterized protein n=1 Tax=Sipha flava TaxID=143950 RepID=A0A2S2Q0D2_9HEMI
MLNLLRYPATISFEVNSPFSIKKLRSIRCGDCPGNTKIRVFYEDLLEIELQLNIDMRDVPIPKMPLTITTRKSTAEGRLFAHCENSYFKPKTVALFKAHIYFPILKLSTKYINFGEVVVRETKSMDVMLSSYPGPERFVTSSKDDVFAISPGDGVVSHMPTSLTISFRPKAHKRYSNKIEIWTTIPMDVIYLKVSGFGIK